MISAAASYRTASHLFRLRLAHPSGMIVVDAFDANRLDPITGHSYIDIEVRRDDGQGWAVDVGAE